MSGTDRARQLAFEAAERRVLENLRGGAEARSSARRLAVLAGAAALFAATFAARLAITDPDALIANFYVIPIAVLAIEFGARAGVLGAAIALALVFAWSAIETVHVDALGYAARGAALAVTGVLAGRLSERLRHDIDQRRRAQRDLSLYADELERANQHLAQSVERLEAFAEIARAVGGETDLERVLSLITAHGREIVGARQLLVCLPEGDDLVAVSDGDSPAAAQLRLPLSSSLSGQVLRSRRPQLVTARDHPRQLDQLTRGARTAILVPLVFRGETLGVLAGIDRDDGREFGAEDEQLLLSVAASAATAVSTARSVAAERLRLSLEAAEQARARWARELHDETLQGLSGVRMVLGAGLARDDLAALRDAAEAADAHLGVEMRGLRDLITELRPAALDDLGLGPAIESLANRQAAAGGFEAELVIELGAVQRPLELDGAIYRIIQEALTNVVRHACAEHVTVSVRQLAHSVEIGVWDDGHGFAPGASDEGFGLTGMRERAMLLGGTLSVASSEGGPTDVTALLPQPGYRGISAATRAAADPQPSTS
jgi:signal transduction histidine kinase